MGGMFDRMSAVFDSLDEAIKFAKSARFQPAFIKELERAKNTITKIMLRL